MEWIPIAKKKPPCKRDPEAFGTPVLIWPREPDPIGSMGIDGHCYYGRRATGNPAFYKYGAEIRGITHWMPMPTGPKD